MSSNYRELDRKFVYEVFLICAFSQLLCMLLACKSGQVAKADTGLQLVTPEQFGAIGDGKIRLLSSAFKTIDEARKVYPSAKDLDITIDGAAFQKAVDFIYDAGGGTILCEKNYAINFPIETKNNVTIDGNGKGNIYNDCSRKKYGHDIAFFVGNHHPVAFNPNAEIPNSYKIYECAAPVSAGDRSISLKQFEKVKNEFEIGQIVWLTSQKTFYQRSYAWYMDQSFACKITDIKAGRLYFEYPIEETIPAAQIAANGGRDRFMEIDFKAVQNLTIKNLNINAGSLTNHTWGYKCLFENLNLVNTTHLIVLNSLNHSIIRNIKGTYYNRCIEVKSGAEHLLISNIQATFKAPDGIDTSIGIISTGEYNRKIVIDSFYIDMKNSRCNQALITIQAREATIRNGTIISPNHNKAFIKFYNDYNVSNPKLAAFGNNIENIHFKGSTGMPFLIIVGEPDQFALRMQKEKNATQPQWPNSNTITACTFQGGNSTSKLALYGGSNNTIDSCFFAFQPLIIESNDFSRHNKIQIAQSKKSNNE